MSERDLSGTWFTGERKRNISGAFASAVSDWAESLTCSGTHASGVSALNKRMSEKNVNEMFNRQGFKLKHMQIMYFCDCG